MILYLFNQWLNHLDLKGVNYNKLYVCSSNSYAWPHLVIESGIGMPFYQWAEKIEFRNVKWFV